MKKVVIAPSSLPAGRNMSSQLEYIERVGNFGADMYHLDVMDGEYVRYKTIDHTYIEALREKSALFFDCHLMVLHPEKVIKKYLKSSVNLITVHYEVFENKAKLISMLKRIRKAGKLAGLAIELKTSETVIEPLLKYLDMVLVMSVESGKGGQEFNKTAIKKIRAIRNLNQELLIEVDGGINPETAAQCVKAGADILVSGSYIYNNDTYIAMQELRGKTI